MTDYPRSADTFKYPLGSRPRPGMIRACQEDPYYADKIVLACYSFDNHDGTHRLEVAWIPKTD